MLRSCAGTLPSPGNRYDSAIGTLGADHVDFRSQPPILFAVEDQRPRDNCRPQFRKCRASAPAGRLVEIPSRLYSRQLRRRLSRRRQVLPQARCTHFNPLPLVANFTLSLASCLTGDLDHYEIQPQDSKLPSPHFGLLLLAPNKVV